MHGSCFSAIGASLHLFVIRGSYAWRPGLDRIVDMQTDHQKAKWERVYNTTFASFYPNYVSKAERKGRTVEEVNEVICWLTGLDDRGLEEALNSDITMREFFETAPHPNDNRHLITGVVCGVKVQELTDPLQQNIRYLDKLVDELAKGKAMEKILRQP